MSPGWKERLAELGLARKRRAAPRPAGAVAPADDAEGARRRGRGGRASSRRAGLSVLARNVRAGGGEIDLVARDGGDGRLRRGEVAARRLAWGSGRGRHSRKRRKLLSAARAWLAENPSGASRDVRFDVVAIEGEAGTVDWIRGAFDAT